ncbi:MAG: TIGR00297 family protein [Terriglobales bacterium]
MPPFPAQFGGSAAAVFTAAVLAQGPFVSEVQRYGLAAAIITAAFALLACRMQSVAFSGAIAGSVVSFLLFVCAGPGGFAVLAAVFALTAASTRLRYEHKRQLGFAEGRRGRNARQVLANLAVGTILAVFSLYAWREPLLLAALASLAEAAADTVSSEVGKALAPRAYMITTFERAPIGTDGAISLIGTLAGAAAAVLVALVGAWSRLAPSPQWIAAAAGAGILGSFVDSFLGATLQQRGWVSNSAVNLVSTAAAAGLALLFLL